MTDQLVADFTLPATGGTSISLSALRGQPVVLYFYPKDSTPGCTTEAQQFRDLHPEFTRLGATVLGVTPSPILGGAHKGKGTGNVEYLALLGR